MPPHSHGDVSHDHPDAVPGHTHDADPTTPVDTAPPPGEPTGTVSEPAPVTEPAPAPSAAAAATTAFLLRAVLTVAGAAGIIGGAFLGWLTAGGDTGAEGTSVPVQVFWSRFTTELQPVNFLASAGLVMIIIGLVALIGVALPTGWLTRLAGALAVIAFLLFLIQLLRTSREDIGGLIELGASNIGIGMWLILAGGILAVVGGFFGARPRPVATA